MIVKSVIFIIFFQRTSNFYIFIDVLAPPVGIEPTNLLCDRQVSTPLDREGIFNFKTKNPIFCFKDWVYIFRYTYYYIRKTSPFLISSQSLL